MKDWTGKRVGQLTVLRENRARLYGEPYWRCRCDCGRELTFSATWLSRANQLRHPASCLCKGSKNPARGMKRAAEAPEQIRGTKGSRSGAYSSWNAAKQRCHNPKCKAWERYGGKGISMCRAWRLSFDQFFADMGPRPPGRSLDRYPDADGNYEPKNCRWATPLQQGWSISLRAERKSQKKFAAVWEQREAERIAREQEP